MKKTIIALMALSNIVMAESYTYKSELLGSLDNATAHGFTLNINNATNIVPANTATPATLEGSYTLSKISFTSRVGAANGVSTGEFGLLVLDSSKKIVGWTSNTQTFTSGTTAAEFVYNFTFSNTTIDAASTYTLAAVGTDIIAAAVQGYTYTPSNGQLAVNSDAQTIGGGLKIMGVRVDLHNSTNSTGANWVTAGNLDSEKGTWGVVMNNITLSTPEATVPEPTTATLSLLALAGLAARRRRK